MLPDVLIQAPYPGTPASSVSDTLSSLPLVHLINQFALSLIEVWAVTQNSQPKGEHVGFRAWKTGDIDPERAFGDP